MTYFPLISEAEVSDPEAAKVYEEIRQELGFGIVPNIFKSMAIRPSLLRVNWDKFRATILQGYLPRTLKEMIGILISQANGSEYALRVHLHGLSAMGMSEEVLQALVRDYQHCPLPEREKSILRFGLLVATDPLQLGPADYEELRQHNLIDEEIFEIIATADLFASINASVYALIDEEIFEIIATADLFASINAYTDGARIEIDQLG